MELALTFYLQSDDGTLMPSSQKPVIRFSEGLPVGTYRAKTAVLNGVPVNVLAPADDLVVSEKQYGTGPKKINRILKAYGKMDRSLGVILSGPKGIGKSMFARQLSIEARNKLGMSTIIVDANVQGITEILESIDDECLVLFDEFDKTYTAARYQEENDETGSEQNKLLSLFDGVSFKKKLYVVTCNQLYGLSDLIVDRPGRFHYHIRFGYPDAAQITQYMLDNLDAEAQTQIPEVLEFCKFTELNYDQLRAIAFELNLGGEFTDVIDDLNILNQDDVYSGELTGADGRKTDFYFRYHDLTDEDVKIRALVPISSKFDDTDYDHDCSLAFSFKQSDIRLDADGSLSTTAIKVVKPCDVCRDAVNDKKSGITEEDLFHPVKATIHRQTDYKSYSYNL